jgi:hypothetical protein
LEGSHLRIASRAVLAVAAASALVIPAVAAAGPASAAAHRAAVPAAGGYSVLGSLAGVAASSTRSAWAVGFAGKATSPKVLMLHWNGSKWNRFTSPKVLTEPGALSAVTVVSANSAWAVGSSGSFPHPRTLILHWNGKTWSEVASPKPVAGGSLSAVTANASGGWAVGSLTTGPTVPQTMPLIFKLTGTKWSRSDPKFGAHSGVLLNGVASTPTATFATGLFTGMITGVLARLSGQSWSFVSSFPQQGTFHWLNAIAAGPHGIAFAVGYKTSAGLGVVSIEWNGHAWVKAPAPNSANLNTVAFAPGGAGTAWAAGYRDGGSTLHPLILRWNGHSWASVTSPGGSAQLTGLGFASGNYGWAVGNSDPDSGQSKTLIEHWNGHAWH